MHTLHSIFKDVSISNGVLDIILATNESGNQQNMLYLITRLGGGSSTLVMSRLQILDCSQKALTPPPPLLHLVKCGGRGCYYIL